MNTKSKANVPGGKAVAKKYGSAYMSKIGKRGRKKQLQTKQSNS